MGVSGVSLSSMLSVQTAVEMRNQLNDLNRQLGTGKRADSYAGLGLDRGLTVGLRAHLASIESYQQAITHVGVRLDIAQTALSQISSLAQSTKNAIVIGQYSQNGETLARDQNNARMQLDQILGLLNTSTGDRYLFSGKSVDKPAVEGSDVILNGSGMRAGLKQVINERRQADLGASGLGRLVVSAPTATSIRIAEDAVSPFGLKIAGIVSGLTGATVIAPGGSPPAETIDLGATNPNNGETVKFAFTLPDGSSEDITLTATTTSPPGSNQFLIGATSDVTAANLQTALTQALSTLGGTALVAASAVAAGDDFFNTDSANPPQRVNGPPFNIATTLVNGTAANTVMWYIGEAGTDPARSTAIVRADQEFAMAYGMRANEQALRSTVQSIAVFAAISISPADPNAVGCSGALQQRIGAALAVPAGQQDIVDIEVDLAGVQKALASSKERHQKTASTLAGLLQQVEGVSMEQVGVQILALQTSLQATLQTTALLLQTNLLKYL